MEKMEKNGKNEKKIRMSDLKKLKMSALKNENKE